MANKAPTYETLDAIVVVAALLIVGGGIAGLIFFTVPGENLAVVSGLLGTIAGTLLGGYAGFRWGATARDTRAPSPVLVVNEPQEAIPTTSEEKL